jgi:DNA invertase Pin-like site-specific DNA recombinase
VRKLSEKVFGYARVSSKEQNLDRQIDELRKYVPNAADIIFEKQSGKDFERPEYKKLRMMMREGDTLYLMSLDRLGRNKIEVKQELENLRATGVNIRILDIPTTLMDFGQYGDMQRGIMEMVNNILIEVLSTMAESERRTIRKRQAEGIAAAKARGKHLGRPKLDFPDNWIAVYQRWQNKEITAVAAMQELDMKKTSFYKLVRLYQRDTGK